MPEKHSPDRISWQYLEKNRGMLKRYIRVRFSRRIEILQEFAHHQFELTLTLLHHITIKDMFGFSYTPNKLIPHVLIVQPTLTNSILLLLKNGYYGSARPLIRQNYEFLLMAKYADLDNSIAIKWENKKEGWDPSNQISLSRDIFSKLSSEVKINELKTTWALLCDVTHGTQFAQQPPPAYTRDKRGEAEKQRDASNTHHTLDLAFMNLCMSYHLLNMLHSKARGFYFGYNRDPSGEYDKVKKAKFEIKNLMDEYYAENKKEKIDSRKYIGPAIRQFSAKWNLKPQSK